MTYTYMLVSIALYIGYWFNRLRDLKIWRFIGLYSNCLSIISTYIHYKNNIKLLVSYKNLVAVFVVIDL